MKHLLIILLSIFSISLYAQDSLPKGNPSPKGNTRAEYAYLQADSGFIPALRDTNWTPRFKGTQVFWYHAGVDTATWTFVAAAIGPKWVKSVPGTGSSGGIGSVALTMPTGFSVGGSPVTPPSGTLNVTTTLNGVLRGTGSGFGVVTIGAGLSYTAPTLSTTDWHLTGNTGTTAGTNFVGTTNSQGLVFKVNNTQSGFIDNSVLKNLSFGKNTFAITATGGVNSAFGVQALQDLTSGSANTAHGYNGLTNVTTGGSNTAVGSQTLINIIEGSNNTAVGASALSFVGTAPSEIGLGDNNTAVGAGALSALTQGDYNIGIGSLAGNNGNIVGDNNIVIGKNGNLPSDTGSNQLNIQNTIYGLDNAGEGEDSTQGKIGIGIRHPQHKLDIAGDLRVQTITDGTAGTDSVLVQSGGVVKKISPTYYGSGGGGGGTWDASLIAQGATPIAASRTVDWNGNDFTLSNMDAFTIRSNLSNSPYSVYQFSPTYNNFVSSGDSTEASLLVQNINTLSTTLAKLSASNTNTNKTHFIQVNPDSILIKGSLASADQTNLVIRGLPYGNDTTIIKPLGIASNGKVYTTNWFGAGGGADSLESTTKINGNSPYYISVGDSITSTVPPTQSIIFYGNSITAEGTFITEAASLAHAIPVNKGISSTTMQQEFVGDSSMYDRRNTIPTFNSTIHKALGFEYSTNDANRLWTDTATFRAQFYVVLDTAIARGWPLNRIVIMTSGYYNSVGANETKRQQYNTIIRSIARIKGVGLGDVDKLLFEEGLYNNRGLIGDSLHPNAIGNTYWTNAFLNGLGIKHSTVLNVNGNTKTNYLTIQQANLNRPEITFRDTVGAVLFNVDVTNSATASLYFGNTNSTNTSAAINNTSFGYAALQNNTTGTNNAAFGKRALNANTTGSYNTAYGEDALSGSTTGSGNTAYGYQAMLGSSSLTGVENVGIGGGALAINTSGSHGTAVGTGALNHNTTGGENTAIGHSALTNNSTGESNIAMGFSALGANTTASYSVAIGNYSQRLADGAGGNTSVGQQTLYGLTSGFGHTAIGIFSLLNITNGIFDVGLGNQSGRYAGTGGGTVDNTTSSYSVYIGSLTRASANGAQKEIVIGHEAVGRGNNTAKIGDDLLTNFYTTGILHAPTPSGSISDSLVVWHPADSSFRKIPVASLGGGSPLFLTSGTATATGSVIGSLAGNTLQVQSGGNDFLKIDPSTDNETVLFQAYNPTSSSTGTYTAHTDAGSGEANMIASYNEGTKTSIIKAYANDTYSDINYTSESHIFNGNTRFTSNGTPGTGKIPVGTDGSGNWEWSSGSSLFPLGGTGFATAEVVGVMNGFPFGIADGEAYVFRYEPNEGTPLLSFTASTHTFNGITVFATPYTPSSETDSTYPNGTLTQDDTFLYYRTSTGDWVKIAWAPF